MSADVSKRVAEFLDAEIEERDLGQPHFGSSDFEPFPFPPISFYPIRDVKSSVRAAYVDGGNQEIIGAPNFSVQINRVYFNIFRGRERILPKSLPSKMEFFSVTTSDFRDKEIFYDTRVFPLKDEFAELVPDERHLSFNSFDRTVTQGTQRADIRTVASMARRFAEWEISKHIVEKELQEGDLIVHDGSLQTSHTNEQTYTSRAFKAALDKGVIYTGISKTSTLFTTTGLSLLGAVQKLAEEKAVKGPWCVPMAKVITMYYDAFIYVVKLHESARYVFRFDIHGEQARRMSEEDLCNVTSVLADNSKDISFPGYPYGLMDADTFAHVSENEVSKYQALVLSEISKLGKWNKISRHVSSGDAHGVLDALKG